MPAPHETLRDGRYRLSSRLRSGGSGVIWRGVDVRTGEVLAFKAIPIAAGGVEAATHEAEAALRVRHPGVLRVHAAFVEGDQGYLVMELAACSLADVVDAHGPVPRPVAVALGVSLCETLSAAHAAGVVHRDVKPHNVLVMADGTVRLADWGIARVHADGLRQTRTGALLGTLAYMAPEQRRDPRAVVPATDLYALAATLAFAATGEPPGELYVPGVAATLIARLGAPLGQALADAGRHNAADRPQSANAFADRLREAEPGGDAPDWLRRHTIVVGEAPTLASPHAPTPRRWGPAAAVTAATMVASAIILVGTSVESGTGRPAAAPSVDPVLALPLCDDAPGQWVVQAERGPKQTVDADVADADGDGVPDALFANQGSGTVTIRWGRANALPADATEVATGPLAAVPEVVDVNRDGRPDLATADTVWFGDGHRGFRAGEARATTPGGGTPWDATDLAIHGADAAWRPARAFTNATGRQLWLLADDAVGRSSIADDGHAEAPTTVRLPGRPVAVVRDASHPGAAVVRINGDASAWLVRAQPDEGTACRIGITDFRQRINVVADLDADGLADLIETQSCIGCDSSHRIYRGVR